MNTDQAINALGALAQETRLSLFRMLVQLHLQHLLHAGLITQRRVSRPLFYAADFTAMNELMAYLSENCCGGAAKCPPVCNPAAAFGKGGEVDETPARTRRR